MIPEESKQCRVGRDRERPSVVFSHHLSGQDSIIACARCGYFFGSESLKAKMLEQKRLEQERKKPTP